MTKTLSSISKKVLMALLGLFLIVFLLVHLGINLFMLPLTSNHIEIFENASHFMGTNVVIKIFEVVLFGGFIIHIFLGLLLYFQNRASRPVKYYSSNKSDVSFFSKYMIHTGIIIFLFLIIHFTNFYFIKIGWVVLPEGIENRDALYDMAVQLFTQPVYSVFYLVIFVFLGFHLNHAFQSAFQSLGLNHNKYTPTIKKIGTVYAIIVSVGFALIPLYFLFLY